MSRGGGGMEGQDMWESGNRRVVEEVDSDEDDSDAQQRGVGLASGSRFVSDPLRFTGVDLGEGSGAARPRRSYGHQQDEGKDDEDDTSENYDSEDDLEPHEDTQAQIALRDREEALVESALARIRRAQTKGKKDVRLNQEELAALERRRQRIQAENGRKKRKEKEQRFAVPISQLEPTSRKRRSIVPEEPISQQAASGSFHEEQGRANYPPLPPMGYFPPPLAPTRARPRSGTASSQRPPSRDPALDRSRGSSPFRYSYVQRGNHPPSASRHVSDNAPRPQSSGSREEAWPGSYGQAASGSISAPSIPSAQRQQQGMDPFQYMTAGSLAPRHAADASARRPVSGPAAGTGTGHYMYPPGATSQDTVRSGTSSRRRSSDDTSEETTSDGESTSDEHDPVTRVASSGSGPPAGGRRGRSREDIIIIEDSPEPLLQPEREVRREREPSTHRGSKKPSGGSPVKRKPVSGGTSGRKRKGSTRRG